MFVIASENVFSFLATFSVIERFLNSFLQMGENVYSEMLVMPLFSLSTLKCFFWRGIIEILIAKYFY